MNHNMNRRQFVKTVGLGIAAFTVPGCKAAMGQLAGGTPTNRPNIVLIMADDMGYSDIGCYGGEVRTPNLKRLADNGLRFTQFYNTARCCPTRASLLTGLYSHQAGMGHMVKDKGYPAYQGYLNDRCVTIAEVLKTAGYNTLMSGKWHVGEKRPHWPLDRGFDKYYGLISGAANYFDISKTKASNVKRTMAIGNKPFTPKPGKFYMTDAFTENAVRFIDSFGQREGPFFLYLAYTAPHWPLHARPEDIAKYKGKYMKGWDLLRKERYERMIKMGLISKDWKMTPRDPQTWPWAEEKNKESMDFKMAIYAAQIDRMDQGIGQVVAALENAGCLDNTLIFFLSDNGGCAEGGPVGFDRRKNGLPPGGVDSYMSYGLSWANASNTPFRRYKSWVHEGGIATPLIVHWPACIKDKGRLRTSVGHVIDIMATCLDVAGAKYPARYKGHDIIPTEGRSLVPAFANKPIEREALYWEHEGNRAVRKGRWKLVSRRKGGDGHWELYDMQADRTELNDLAKKQPEKVEQLKAMYESWAERCGVRPWPIPERQKTK